MENEKHYLVYKNRFNEVNPYYVEILSEDETYLEVFGLWNPKYKTFKKENVLSRPTTLEMANLEATELQKNYQIHVPEVRGPRKMNIEDKLEVCFTGFKANERKELETIAEAEGLFVRGSVTRQLGLLVLGENAGWKKVSTARKQGIACVSGKDGFEDFLETGEFLE